jgi:hypothetical protein
VRWAGVVGGLMVLACVRVRSVLTKGERGEEGMAFLAEEEDLLKDV